MKEDRLRKINWVGQDKRILINFVLGCRVHIICDMVLLMADRTFSCSQVSADYPGSELGQTSRCKGCSSWSGS